MTRRLEERVFANGTWFSPQEFYDQCCAHNLERRPWAGHRRVRRDAGSSSAFRGGNDQTGRFERQQRVLFCCQFATVGWPKPLLGSVRLGRSNPTTHLPAVLPAGRKLMASRRSVLQLCANQEMLCQQGGSTRHDVSVRWFRHAFPCELPKVGPLDGCTRRIKHPSQQDHR